MELGWCDVCLRVNKVLVSREFYGDLGFWQVEGSDEEGWAVVTNGDLRLGLFEPQYMTGPISLNFRGGEITDICAKLSSKGHAFSKPPKLANGGGSVSITDPDGTSIFFDCIAGETKKVEPIS